MDGAAAGTKGNPNLTLTMNSDHTVIATFVQTWKLTINVVGSGSVGVASSPAASGSNPYTLNNGTAVTLTPTAAAGYGFVGWTVQGGQRRGQLFDDNPTRLHHDQ